MAVKRPPDWKKEFGISEGRTAHFFANKEALASQAGAPQAGKRETKKPAILLRRAEIPRVARCQ
jgi:hypothetical protein